MLHALSLGWTRLWARLGAFCALRSPVATARVLRAFSRTEAQSRLELLAAVAVCPDAERRALYLRHALDEARHAGAFADRAQEMTGERCAGARAGSENLFERWGEERFLAFIYRGERRGRTEFEVYGECLRRRGDVDSAALLERVIRDERRHEAYSRRLLDELAASEAPRALRFAARQDLWRTFRRRGQSLARLTYHALMLALYLLLTPYALAFRLFAPRPSGFSRDR